MSGETASAQWYYVGHYGQLGPLTLQQVGELIQDGVVGPDTFVWQIGMSDWVKASVCTELAQFGLGPASFSVPPPVPTAGAPITYHPAVATAAPLAQWAGSSPVSDRNRTLGGVLNFIPGVGRIYLAYPAIGVLQLLSTVLCGVGAIWAVIDAIYILAGGLKFDGYGRQFSDS